MIQIRNRYTGAVIREVDAESLSGANLTDADLRGANLHDATLRGANLTDADLRDATLRGADLTGANLTDADLRAANLYGANLHGANLTHADLHGANLYGANLYGAKLDPLDAAQLRIVPEGDLVVWKQCLDGVLVKLRIPAAARRSNATTRKCRAEFAEVLEVEGDTQGLSAHDRKTVYRIGETVRCDAWCEDWTQECAGGIHFFLTREEAEAY